MTHTLPPPQIPGLTYLQKLGSGGYADVYLYEQAMPARKVAVKVLREGGLSAQVVGRFTAEANAMAQLEHPHIVPVYAASATGDGRPYIVMMYYPKANLAERVRRGRLAVAEVLRVGIQIGSAVETAHRSGLLHRDIKPANILTNQYGTPGLTDFGIAGQVTAHDDEETGVSVPWSPPEILYATQPASVRSDVYSLAATLWHLLVGRSPFEIPGGDNSPFALMRRIRDTPAPSTGRSDVPTSLDRLLRTAMSREPQARPASALDLVRSLQSIEQELRLPRTPIVVAEETVVETTGRVDRPGADATRVQAPQVVRAQPSLPPVVARPVEPPDPPSVAAVNGPTPTDLTSRRGRSEAAQVVSGSDDSGPPASTRLRGRALEPDPGPDDSDAGHKSRWVVVALAAVVVGLIVGIGVLLSSGQGSASPEQSSAATEPAPPLGAGDAPPGKLTITVTVSGSKVVFTWGDYDNQQDSDYYKWWVWPDGKPQRTKLRQAEVTSSSGAVCIVVQVVRADGVLGSENKKCQ